MCEFADPVSWKVKVTRLQVYDPPFQVCRGTLDYIGKITFLWGPKGRKYRGFITPETKFYDEQGNESPIKLPAGYPWMSWKRGKDLSAVWRRRTDKDDEQLERALGDHEKTEAGILLEVREVAKEEQ